MSKVLDPATLAAPGDEHSHQTAFFCALSAPHLWAVELVPVANVLPLMYAVPSGGARDVVTAGRLKAEGVKAGVPDTHLPIANRWFHSLYIEFKVPSKVTAKDGGLSPAQITFRALLQQHGNAVEVAYGWQHGLAILKWYLFCSE